MSADNSKPDANAFIARARNLLASPPSAYEAPAQEWSQLHFDAQSELGTDEADLFWEYMRHANTDACNVLMSYPEEERIYKDCWAYYMVSSGDWCAKNPGFGYSIIPSVSPRNLQWEPTSAPVVSSHLGLLRIPRGYLYTSTYNPHNSIDRYQLSRDMIVSETLVDRFTFNMIMGQEIEGFMKGSPAVAYYIDMLTFCNKLSEAQGLTPFYDIARYERSWGRYWRRSGRENGLPDFSEGEGWRLPTAFEWEYCARAGLTTGDRPNTALQENGGLAIIVEHDEGLLATTTRYAIARIAKNCWGFKWKHTVVPGPSGLVTHREALMDGYTPYWEGIQLETIDPIFVPTSIQMGSNGVLSHRRTTYGQADSSDSSRFNNNGYMTASDRAGFRILRRI